MDDMDGTDARPVLGDSHMTGPIAASPLPLVGIAPDAFVPGLRTLNDSHVPSLTILPFVDAFRKQYDGDNHFVSYVPRPLDDPSWPRCNIEVLPSLRAAGVDLTTTMLVLDYDLPSHKTTRWTPETLREWLDKLMVLADTWPIAWQWTLLYTTRGGARLVYVLDEPMPVEQTPPAHQWLCQQFCTKGIEIDLAVSDWTRLFRLPKVVREGVPSWSDPNSLMLEQLDNRLAVADLGAASFVRRVEQIAEVAEYRASKPDANEASDLLTTVGVDTGMRRKTEWYKAVKKRLTGRECYAALFEYASLADVGSRNDRLIEYVGQVVGLLYGVENTTPEHVYALFLPAVEQLDPDKDTPDWTRVLWSAVCRLWTREMGKAKAKEVIAEAKAVQALSLIEQITNGMREWCDAPELLTEDQAVSVPWVQRHLIAAAGGHYFLMSPNGYYESMQLSQHLLIPRIRITGLDTVIPTTTMRDDGTVADKNVIQIVNDYATVIRDVRAVPGGKGGRIEHLDSGDASMVLPSYAINDALSPTFDPDVDMWLRQMFHDENYDRAIQWLQWSLAFDQGPICALSIAGTPGVGKKLLVKGLSECLKVPAIATAADLVGTSQYGLMNSPFLVINEGWPRTQQGMHPADSFRAMVSGDPLVVNRKYMHPVNVLNPVRIILTANNLDVVRMLSSGRDLSPEDRDALAIRLLHLDVGGQAACWLRLKGGTRFTARNGHRWIGGDAGEPSDFIVAKHLLWLYAQRTTPPGTRFLVEGGNSAEIMFDMRTGQGSAPLVIESIIGLLNLQSFDNRNGIVIENGRLFVTTHEILAYFRDSLSGKTRESLKTGTINQVIRGLTARGDVKYSRKMDTKAHMGLKMWHELDASLLLKVAAQDGLGCPRLEKLVMGAELSQIRGDAEKSTEIPDKAVDKQATQV